MVKGYDKGIEKWKYFAFHFFMMTIWGLGMYVTLYCCGIGVLASALISGSAFPPFMIVTMLAETKIFKSRFFGSCAHVVVKRWNPSRRKNVPP